MAFHRYASFKGETQGQLKGNAPKSKRGDKWFELTSFEFGLGSRVGAPQGPSGGKRGHMPLVITKDMDSASPQLFNACRASEIFNELVIEIVERADTGAGERVVERISLTNAVISHVNRYVPSLQKSSRQRPNNLLEEYGFTFQKIQWDKR